MAGSIFNFQDCFSGLPPLSCAGVDNPHGVVTDIARHSFVPVDFGTPRVTDQFEFRRGLHHFENPAALRAFDNLRSRCLIMLVPPKGELRHKFRHDAVDDDSAQLVLMDYGDYGCFGFHSQTSRFSILFG